jgi:hypothetical protein
VKTGASAKEVWKVIKGRMGGRLVKEGRKEGRRSKEGRNEGR